jgi:hypothetical protein
MSTSHEFLALPEDFAVVDEFLRTRGADLLARDPERSSLIYHFSALGPVTFWKAGAVTEASTQSQWKAAMMAELRQRESPEIPQINQFESPVAGATPPTERVPGVWNSSSVWFATPRLRETFPALAKINSDFQRWLRRHPLVFDNTGRETFNADPFHLAGFTGLVIKVFALPLAAERLSAGGYFVHQITSATTFSDFLRQAELRGERVGG